MFCCRFGRAIVVYHGERAPVKKNRTFYVVVTETDFFGMSSGAAAKALRTNDSEKIPRHCVPQKDKGRTGKRFFGRCAPQNDKEKGIKTRLLNSLRGCFSQPLRRKLIYPYIQRRSDAESRRPHSGRRCFSDRGTCRLRYRCRRQFRVRMPSSARRRPRRRSDCCP